MTVISNPLFYCPGMINTAVVSLHYFPNISFLSLLAQYDKLIIEASEHYNKQSFRNRCQIAGANGVQNLVLPVKKISGRKQMVRDVEISYGTNWQHQHWHALKSAYRSSPYYEFYVDEIAYVFHQRHSHLFDLNKTVLELMIELLQIECEYEFSEEYINGRAERLDDYRMLLSPKQGKEVAKYHQYYQVFSGKYGFVPNLSVLDLLFNEGPRSSEILSQTEFLTNRLQSES